MPYPFRLLTVVKGVLTSAGDNHSPIKGKVIVKDSEGARHGEYKTNILTGKYLMILNPDVDYSITFEATGYVSKTVEQYYKKSDEVKSAVLNIELERE